MSPRTKILLLTAGTETLAAVAAALKNEGRFAVEVCPNLQDLTFRLKREMVPVAVVDIDSAPERLLEDLDRLVAEFPQTGFIALASELRNEWILAAMKAGTRYFLGKDCMSPDLSDVLERLVPATADEPQGRGVAVTVLSASGGCGATTVAINLCDALHRAAAAPALLVDMDAGYGAVAHYLGIKVHYGLADVLGHSEIIDSQLVRSTMHTHSEGLRVLVNPASVNFASPLPLHFERLDRAMDVFKQMGPYTVVDAPRLAMDVAATLARHSKVTLIAMQLNVKDVRIVQAMIAALIEHRVPVDRILPLVNRSRGKNSMISLEDARKVLGIPVAQIRNDYRAAIRAMNYGQLLSKAAPHSDLARGIDGLAGRIHEATGNNTVVTV